LSGNVVSNSKDKISQTRNLHKFYKPVAIGFFWE
jgi:hypothetical protein